jgi:histidinol-phosphate aminotransferase
VRGAGGSITSVPLSNLRIDLAEVREAIEANTKLVFVNNPNNPTGSVASDSEMRRFLGGLPEGILVALDEAYIEFVTDEGGAEGTRLLKDFPRVIVLRTFSKLYGLAGLRVGYGFAAPELVDYMNRVRQPFNVNSLAQAAATAALDDEAFVSKTLRLVRDGLDYLYGELETMGMEYVATQTNFFLIKVPQGGKRIYELMLREGVIVRSMESYGLPEYIRINVGLPEENERFIKTLAKVLPTP